MHRHSDREGVPGEARWPKGHLQLPRLDPPSWDQDGGAFDFVNQCQFLATIGYFCQKLCTFTFVTLWYPYLRKNLMNNNEQFIANLNSVEWTD